MEINWIYTMKNNMMLFFDAMLFFSPISVNPFFLDGGGKKQITPTSTMQTFNIVSKNIHIVLV